MSFFTLQSVNPSSWWPLDGTDGWHSLIDGENDRFRMEKSRLYNGVGAKVRALT
jgi:hypothetical protein